MSTVSPPIDLSRLSLESPPSSTSNDDSRWARAPVTLLERDMYSRFVVFDGRREVCLYSTVSVPSTHDLEQPYIEPHFVELTLETPGRDPDFDKLVEARWYEYLAEGYLRSTGSKLTAAGGSLPNVTHINTPVQLYLARRRLARAQLEIKIYTDLLRRGASAALEERMLFLSRVQ